MYGYRNLPGDLHLAELDFRRFTEWAPTEWAGWNDLAWILAKQENYEEMKAIVERAFKNVPAAHENPWLWNALGIAKLNMGDTKRAAVAFRAALEHAERLSLADWRRAYSGNDPSGDAEGLEAFLAGIKENLSRAQG
jgi:Flp pilus assembly protein TadD